ncbi:patatin-like phospholipase family protein [Lachnoclostridium sp. Marseille-P6806]|uniref:patatin-like phospholipase family protein n=1 Tax=Lachnoclostridium sp. Marseille-P6806 TaxID=2364793 RepID=UPI0010310C45|nr:patatin family protein [Lachnoclostridium sp. Marseille-P6806]
MIGIVDVGGGTRGVYGAGVFDYLIDRGIRLPYCIGVSAGSANAITYMAGQRGRTYRFYTEYVFRREYMGAGLFFRTGSYINLDYIYAVLSNEGGEYPLDFDAFAGSGGELRVVATDADSGETVYFTGGDVRRNDYRILCASSCVPVVCRPYVISGRRYYDGGISDPIPVRQALRDGCDRLIVILTRPRGQLRTNRRDRRLAGLIRRSFPAAAERLARRAEAYNAELEELRVLERKGDALIVAPDGTEGMKTLTRDPVRLNEMYEKGYRDAQAIPEFIRSA